MNKELMEALDILEKKKKSAKRHFLKRLKILCLQRARTTSGKRIT